MKIISAKPKWGGTLQPGYCGFITRERDFVDDGIEYFEHFETGLPFVHTFVVEGLAPAAGANDYSPSSSGQRDRARKYPLQPVTFSLQLSTSLKPTPAPE